jgi:hypothetical protein
VYGWEVSIRMCVRGTGQKVWYGCIWLRVGSSWGSC